LITARDIDRIVYNDFIYNPFWTGILNILDKCGIETVVDIGASSGLSALWMLERLTEVQKYYCFEPDEENYQMLLINLDRFKSILFPYNYGIYYGEKYSEVFGIGDNSPLGYTTRGAMEMDIHHQFIKYEGKIFYFVELEKMIFTPPDLIKMDVEGSEYNIIEHSTILKQARYLLLAFHNQPEKFVLDFIKENLPDYEIIIYGPDGTIYYNILLERKLWHQSSFLKTNSEQTS
jgi:FkbM family methyltransferase